MAKAYAPLGVLEMSVMEQVWYAGTATAREVCDRLTGKQERAYTTIMTTMERLHTKGVLARAKDANAWRYEPTLSRDAHERAVASALAERIVDAHGDIGLAAFVDVAASDDLLDRLAALIEARRKR